MKGQYRRTIVNMCRVFVVLVAACVTAIPSRVMAEGDEYGNMVKSSEFIFTTTLPDDGKDEGGGWQEAKANVSISDHRGDMFLGWTCKVKMGMPLRTRAHGVVNAKRAARVSADVGTRAYKNVLPRRPPGEWTSGTFCPVFRKEMTDLFKSIDAYKLLGARVEGWS
jgi:hypothetical protein